MWNRGGGLHLWDTEKAPNAERVRRFIQTCLARCTPRLEKKREGQGDGGIETEMDDIRAGKSFGKQGNWRAADIAIGCLLSILSARPSISNAFG